MTNVLTKFKAPISVNIEITEKCNIGCFFCFNDETPYTNSLPAIPSDKKFENLSMILKILAEKGVFEIRWFGGEFSMFKRWRELLETAFDLGFFMSFVTNGTILCRQDIELLAKKEITNGTVSVHGQRNIHDLIVKRPGSFDRATQTIRYMREYGILPAVAFTPNEHNLSNFEKFAREMINDHGASSVGVNRLFHSDRYTSLTLADYHFLFEQIARLQEDGIPAFFIDAFPLCKAPVKYWPFIGGCSQGVTFGQIDYMGNIKNCSGLAANVGNIFDTDLIDIWTSQLQKARYLKHLPLSCRLCPNFCGGGCIASRGVKDNFIPDEFIRRPEEETIFQGLLKTAYNHVKALKYRFITNKEIANRQIVLPAEIAEDTILKPERRFRIRKEYNDLYACLVENKGLVFINERARSILLEIQKIHSVAHIKNTLCLGASMVTNDEIVEVYQLVV